MNRPKTKRQPKPKSVEEWREHAFQRLDQVLGTGASKRHYERVFDMGGLGVVGHDKTDGWRRLDPVAVANGIAAEDVGQVVIEEPVPPTTGEPVPFELDTEWIATMAQAIGCDIVVAKR